MRAKRSKPRLQRRRSCRAPSKVRKNSSQEVLRRQCSSSLMTNLIQMMTDGWLAGSPQVGVDACH